MGRVEPRGGAGCPRSRFWDLGNHNLSPPLFVENNPPPAHNWNRREERRSHAAPPDCELMKNIAITGPAVLAANPDSPPRPPPPTPLIFCLDPENLQIFLTYLESMRSEDGPNGNMSEYIILWYFETAEPSPGFPVRRGSLHRDKIDIHLYCNAGRRSVCTKSSPL